MVPLVRLSVKPADVNERVLQKHQTIWMAETNQAGREWKSRGVELTNTVREENCIGVDHIERPAAV